MPPLTRRTILPAETLKQSGLLQLQERMSRDLFALDAGRRRDEDADALSALLEVEAPEAAEVTGATGYESMLRSPTAGEEDAGQQQQDPATRRRTPALAPTVGMPNLGSIPIRRRVYDPEQEGSIQGPPTYDPVELGTVLSVPAAGTTALSSTTAAPSIQGKNPAVQSRVYQQARASGLDDEGARVLVAISETEGGMEGARGDQGQAVGVFQFHQGGELPGFRAWLRRQGIEGDPEALAVNPEIATRYAAEGYLGQAIARGRELGYSGAELATYVQRTGQRSVRPETTGANYTRLFSQATSAEPAATPLAERRTQAGAAVAMAGQFTRNQGEAGRALGLSWERTLEICGPVAAAAFLRATGRLPGQEEAEAMRVAQQRGYWAPGRGMGGPGTQSQLLSDLGVANRLEQGVDWQKVAADVQRGNPVIIDTSGHYYVAERYNPETGQFDLGQSAAFLRASGGRRWFRPEEIPGLGMGAPRSTIYLDNPETPAPSVIAGRTEPAISREDPAVRREQDVLALTAGLAPAGPSSAPAGAQSPSAGASEDRVLIEELDAAGRPGRKLWVPRDRLPYYLEHGNWRVADADPPSSLKVVENPSGIAAPSAGNLPPPVPDLFGDTPLDQARMASWSGPYPQVRNQAAPGQGREELQEERPPWLASGGDVQRQSLQLPEGMSPEIGADTGTTEPMPNAESLDDALRGTSQTYPEVRRSVERWPQTGDPALFPRQPLSQRPAEIEPGDTGFDPRDADQGPRESGPLPWTPLSPNPEPVMPPQPESIAPPEPDMAPPGSPYAPGQAEGMEAQSGRFEGPTQTGRVVETVTRPERTVVNAVASQIPGTPQYEQGVRERESVALRRFDERVQAQRADRIVAQANEQVQALIEEARALIAQAPDEATQQQIVEQYTAAIDRVERQAAADAAQARQDEIRRQEEMAESRARSGQAYTTADRLWDAADRTVGPVLRAVSDVYEQGRNAVARPVTDILGEEQLGTEAAADIQFMQDAARRYGRFQAMPPEVQARYEQAARRYQAIMAQGGRYASERNPDTETFRTGVDIAASLASIPVMPGYGQAANVLRTGTAAERAGMVGRLAAGAALDPTGAVLQGGIEAPGAVVRGARAAGNRVGRALEANAERVAAADTRMATQGSTVAPGVFGISGLEPDLPAVRGMRPRVVPPDVADTLDYPIRVPEDPAVIRAIEAAGGRVDPERGVDLYVTRAQGPQSAGASATRGGVFYEAVPPTGRSTYAGQNPYDDPTKVGGTQVIPPTPTRFRSPLILSDAPGEMRGFNQAAERLGIRINDPRWPGSTPLLTSADIDVYIRQARKAGPEGSPARAQALKELVARYGGDPDLIDDLLRIRGADAAESAWAIKENILAANARKQGYDGVVTVQKQGADEAAVSAHPKVKEAEALVATRSTEYENAIAAYEQRQDALLGPYARRPDEGYAEYARRTRAAGFEFDTALSRVSTDPQMSELAAAMRRAEDASKQAEQAYMQTLNAVREELPQHRITELVDVREGRNPTPGTLSEQAQYAQQRYADVSAKYAEAVRTNASSEDIIALRAERDAWGQMVDRFGTESVTPPGYELRPDVPRRPETRVSTIAENPRLAEAERALDAAAERSRAAQFALEDAERAHAARPNRENWQAYLAAERELAAARSAWDQARTAFDEANDQGRYVTAPASAGAILPPRGSGAVNRAAPDGGARPRLDPANQSRAGIPTSELLGAATRTLNTEALNLAGGAVAGNVMGGTDPFTNPDASWEDIARNTAWGVAGAATLRHGRRLIGRGRAGPAPDAGGGALATFGSVPGGGNVLGPVVSRWQAATTRAAQQAAAARAAGKAPPPTAMDWIRSVGYSGMIGPSTGIVNAVGNGTELLWHLPKDITRAVVRGKPGEAAVEAKGLLIGFMRAGGEMLDALAGAYPGGGVETARLSQRVQNPIGRFAANLLEAPTRVFSEVPDAFYRSIARTMGEYRAAAQVASDMGLTGQKWSSYVETLLKDVEYVRANPGTRATSANIQRVIADADKLAERLTLRGEVGEKGQAFKDLMDKLGPFGHLMLPFFNTPYQMTQRMLERTPGAGALMGTQPARFDKVYDQIVGTLTVAGMGALAAGGLITASGPDDPEKRKALQAQGWQANSTLVGGQWIPNNAFGVFGPLLDSVGEIGDAIRYQKPDATTRDAVQDALGRVGNVATNQVYLRGISDIIKAAGTPGERMEAYAASVAGRALPLGASARLVATAEDPYERRPEPAREVGSLENIRQRVGQSIPNALPNPLVPTRGELPIDQDILGRPLENTRAGAAAFGPRTNIPRPDPVLERFQASGVDIGAPRSDITEDGVKVDLSPAETRRWNELRGQEIITRTQRLIDNGVLDRMNPVRRAERLDEIKAEASERATEKLRREIGSSEFSRRRSLARQAAGAR